MGRVADGEHTHHRAGLLQTSGVPLGGIGTGAVELGQDSRFRNITINNNRCTQTRIPVSAASFLALRISNGERIYSRILQTELSPQVEQTEPPRLKPHHFEWHCLYPQSDFHLIDPHCPADVYWSGLAPIIPYDLEASGLPSCFVRVKLMNRTNDPLDFAVLFNWENLVGVTRERRPDKLGTVRPVLVRPKSEPNVLRQADEEEVVKPDEMNGLEFISQEFGHDADGSHCLAVKPHEGTTVSVVSWDHEHLGDWRNFWGKFRLDGEVTGFRQVSSEPKCGAVCSSFRLAPQETFSVDFILTWHCPQYTIQGQDVGNSYANRFSSAVDAASEALKHLKYYSASVRNWQQCFLKSSLPRWLNRRLVNSCHIFSTNTVYTREGQFAVLESPERPLAGRLDERLYHSLAVLLFYPKLEAAALQQAAEAVAYHAQRGWIRYSEELSLQPCPAGGPEHSVAIVSNLILCGYRNFISNGILSRTQELYTNFHLLASAILRMDKDGDGLPELELCSGYEEVSVPGLTSYVGSLWVCALRVMAEFSHRLRNFKDSAHYAEQFQTARVGFERMFWDEEHQYYRWHAGEEGGGCHGGQLAGQLFSHFLGFGSLFSDQHIEKALNSCLEHLERDQGVANLRPVPKALSGVENGAALGEDWLSYTIVQLDTLLLRRGHKQDAYRVMQKHFGSLRQRRDLLFEVPLVWDLDLKDEWEGSQRRHRSLLGIWHALFALQGFRYDVFQQKIVIMPQLPEGMHVVATPLFTSFALGWLKFQERLGEQYMQQLEISFESPISVKTIELRLPAEVQGVQVACELPTGPGPVSHEIVQLEEKHLLVHMQRPMSISGAILLQVRGTAAPPPPARGKQRFG